MCNLYAPESPQKISMRFAVAAPIEPYGPTVAPLKPGPIVIAGGALVAQWGLIPPQSPTRVPMLSSGQRMSTNNCRRERMVTANTFRDAWRNGQRCIIPAVSYDEPCWETGKNVWWRFQRADGEAWALAGLWSQWTDPQTGEIVPSFTMITQNCDGHPLLARMHKPDPKLAPDKQDKRCPVPLTPQVWDQWFHGSVEDAQSLITLPVVELFKAGPVEKSAQASLL